MFRFIRNYSGPILWSTLLHVGIFALLVFSLARAVQPRRAPEATVKASVITERLREQDLKRIELDDEEEKLKQQQELERQRAAEEAEKRRAREEEERRQAELEKQRQQEEALRQAEIEKKRLEEEAERQRQVELQRKREEQEAERKRQAELERQRQEEAERKRQAELEKKRQEEEARRQAELKRKEEEERRRKAEEARLRAEQEAELQAALLEEERRLAALDSGLLDQYRALVAQKVERNWIKPPSAGPGLDCEVRVRQFPQTGEVLSVSVTRCNGDAAVVRSIEAAVQRASPLPTIDEPSLQDPNLIFQFRPDE